MRLYPQKLPSVGDLVIVKIKSIEQDLVNVELLEYSCPGIIMVQELSRKKIRNIRQHVRVGEQDIMEVINVDTEKEYIDLSKQYLSIDKEEIKSRYGHAKKLYNFFSRWSRVCENDLIGSILWEHYNPQGEVGVYEYFLNDYSWFNDLSANAEKIIADFKKQFEKPQKYELEMDLHSYALDAVGEIKRAIDKGLERSTKEIPLQCTYTGRSGAGYTLSTLTKVENAMDHLEMVANEIKSLADFGVRQNLF